MDSKADFQQDLEVEKEKTEKSGSEPNDTGELQAGSQAESRDDMWKGTEHSDDIELTLQELTALWGGNKHTVRLGNSIIPGRGGDGYFEIEYHPILIIQMPFVSERMLAQAAP